MGLTSFASLRVVFALAGRAFVAMIGQARGTYARVAGRGKRRRLVGSGRSAVLSSSAILAAALDILAPSSAA